MACVTSRRTYPLCSRYPVLQMFPDNEKVVVNYILYLTELNQPLIALDVASNAMKVNRFRGHWLFG